MIALWLVVLLLQGGDVVAFAYPTEEECREERAQFAALPDTLALSACFQTQLARADTKL